MDKHVCYEIYSNTKKNKEEEEIKQPIFNELENEKSIILIDNSFLKTKDFQIEKEQNEDNLILQKKVVNPVESLNVAFSLGITSARLLSQAMSMPPEAVPSLLGMKDDEEGIDGGIPIDKKILKKPSKININENDLTCLEEDDMEKFLEKMIKEVKRMSDEKLFDELVKKLRIPQKLIDFKYKFLKVLGRIECYDDIDECIDEFIKKEGICNTPLMLEIAKLFFALKLIKKFQKKPGPLFKRPTSADPNDDNNKDFLLKMELLFEQIKKAISKSFY